MTMSLERPTSDDTFTIDCTTSFQKSTGQVWHYFATCFTANDEMVTYKVMLPFFIIEDFREAVKLIQKNTMGTGLRIGKLHKLS